jgi:DNA transposition AAA+ family ATPase
MTTSAIVPAEKSLAHIHGPEAMNALKNKIPGDLVYKATQDLTDRQRNLIRWLFDFSITKNFSTAELGAMLKKEDGSPYSHDTVYQTFTGRRMQSGASLENFCNAIERLQKMEDTRAGTERASFIETALTRRIWKFCRACLAYQRLGFIYAESQVGKTTALTQYAKEHNHGETIYVRMPARGALGKFIRHLCKALRISANLSMWQMEERIFEAIDSRMLLIVDQCHESFRAQKIGGNAAVMLFILEIFDRCNCGIVLAGTGDFERGMMDKAHADEMQQLIRRGIPKPLRLPSRPTTRDLNDFAAYYGLAPASGEALVLQTEIITKHALGVWLTILQSGGRLATKRKETMTWAHVQDAHAGFLAMAGEGDLRKAA